MWFTENSCRIDWIILKNNQAESKKKYNQILQDRLTFNIWKTVYVNNFAGFDGFVWPCQL